VKKSQQLDRKGAERWRWRTGRVMALAVSARPPIGDGFLSRGG
jgi:hypothetical protein